MWFDMTCLGVTSIGMETLCVVTLCVSRSGVVLRLVASVWRFDVARLGVISLDVRPLLSRDDRNLAIA